MTMIVMYTTKSRIVVAKQNMEKWMEINKTQAPQQRAVQRRNFQSFNKITSVEWMLKCWKVYDVILH